MKLAFFMPALHSGGAEIVMLSLAKKFVEAGYSVDFVLAKAEGPYIEDIPKRVNLVNLNANSTFMSLPRLVKYIRHKNPHLIFSTLVNANVTAALAKVVAGTDAKLVLREATIFTSALSAKRSASGLFYDVLSRLLYPKADAVIAISQGVADSLFDRINIPTSKVRVIYNPVISKDFYEKASEPLVDPWFTSNNPPVILSVGRLTKAKDYPTLLRAFAVVRRNVAAHLVILGDGAERLKLEQLSVKLGINKDIRMPGFVKNPYKFMMKSKVFVLPSVWEGFGNVLVEAMACGLPVAATDCPGGPKEILDNGKYGIICHVGDTSCIANAIIQLVFNAKMSEKYRARGKSRVNNFTVETVFKKYLNLFNEILIEYKGT